MERVVVFMPWYFPAFRGGGPIKTMRSMVRRTADPGKCFLVTSNRDQGVKEALDVPTRVWERVDGANVMYVEDLNLFRYLNGLVAARRVHPDIIYLNSAFNPRYSIMPLMLSKVGFWPTERICLAPRGEFHPGALSIKRRKKHMFLHFARIFRLYDGVLWHASNRDEEEHVLRAVGSAQVIVKANEAALPPSAYPIPDRRPGPPRAVFFSRLARKKGLDVLLQALRHCEFPLELDIVGTAEDPVYLKECRALEEGLPPHIVVRNLGPVKPESVLETLADYDAFFLPTRGENFGHAIVEALASALPIYIPDVTPWSGLACELGSLVYNSTVEGWAESIRSFARSQPEDLAEKRRDAALVYNRWAEVQNRTEPSMLELLLSEETWDGYKGH